MTTRRSLGRLGEELAARALIERGYRVHARNWHCPAGEVDIVAQDGETLVFVEVKTRRGRDFGTPEEGVTPAKQARLIELAAAYVQEYDWPGDWRIDVAAVELSSQGRLLRVEIVKNAVGEW
ncbi:MAG: YraN family protein [Chloroflexota bacterium]